jgi:ribosome-associated protein
MAKTEKRQKHVRLPAQVVHAVRAAEDKKATDLVVLDLRKAAGFTDFFVIASGSNPRQVRAIADSVMTALASEGVRPAHVEGYDRSPQRSNRAGAGDADRGPQPGRGSRAGDPDRSEWVLLDYFDFIVHVFAPETRMFYGLERLWGNAERIEIPAD